MADNKLKTTPSLDGSCPPPAPMPPSSAALEQLGLQR